MTYFPTDRIALLLSLDCIHIDDVAEITHQLTKEDVDTFSALIGDYNPLHVDEKFAKRVQFNKPVVHGMLSASFISTMIGMLLPGSGSLWISQSIQFINPAYVGDTLKVTARVKQKSVATRLVVLDVMITNQNGQKIVSGESTVKLLELKKELNIMSVEKVHNVLITGGGGGIGASIAHILAKKGYVVVVTDRRLDAAEQVVSEIIQSGGKAVAFQANVASVEEVGAVFSKVVDLIGPVLSVVHCASPRNELHPFDVLTWDSVQNHLDVQLKGAFNCIQSALPNMITANAGAIVFIGSIAADGVPPIQQADYVVAKSSLTALARCLAVEYGQKGIRVNVVAPGMTQTEMINHLPDKAKMLTRMQTPLRRLAEPADIANTVAFLLSEDAQHITGEVIRVNGGAGM